MNWWIWFRIRVGNKNVDPVHEDENAWTGAKFIKIAPKLQISSKGTVSAVASRKPLKKNKASKQALDQEVEEPSDSNGDTSVPPKEHGGERIHS